MEPFRETEKGAWPGPTEYSALCSIHFEPSCFLFRTRFEIEQMGVRPRRVTLTSVACPTIHAPTPIETTTPSNSSSTQSLIPSTPAAQSQKTGYKCFLRQRTSSIRVLPQRKSEESI